MQNEIRVLVDAKASLGEGPLWVAEEEKLYWVDILGQRLHCFDVKTGQNEVFDVGQDVGTVVKREQEGVMLAVRDGFASFDLETQELKLISRPEAELATRFNDGKCDPQGRFWAGTMAYDNPINQGSLYRMDADLSVHKVVSNVGISNGIVWTADAKTMYYIDSIPRTVSAFDYDDTTGELSNRNIVITVDESLGAPDGMAIDNEGMLWIAHFGGSAVRRWNPVSGEVLETIDIQASQVTACAFGGEGMQTLYITSARVGLSDEQLAKEPHAGALIAIDVEYKGMATFKFRG